MKTNQNDNWRLLHRPIIKSFAKKPTKKNCYGILFLKISSKLLRAINSRENGELLPFAKSLTQRLWMSCDLEVTNEILIIH